MSTHRLYYTDSLLTAFDATVTRAGELDGRAAVWLDETAFYPTSGGQPFLDTGSLGVIAPRRRRRRRRVDGEIAACARAAADRSRCARARRHRLAAPFGPHAAAHGTARPLGGIRPPVQGAHRTTGFHLGAETATIDLAREVTPAEIAAAERAANDVVWADRAVAHPVRLRRVRPARCRSGRNRHRTGELRLVEVPEFDLSACGGTHVPRTGMIGVIAVSAWERFKGGSRLTFVCGGAGACRRHVRRSARRRDDCGRPAGFRRQRGAAGCDRAAARPRHGKIGQPRTERRLARTSWRVLPGGRIFRA